MGMRLEFRRATAADGFLLFDWRNDPQTRAASINGAVIQLNEHLDWLYRSLRRLDRQIFIVERSGLPVGTVRADCVSEGVELSWTVAPECRGEGVGAAMVRHFADSFSSVLVAQVKDTNLASQKIAQAAGLHRAHMVDGLIQFHRGARPPIGAQQAMDGHKQRATA